MDLSPSPEQKEESVPMGGTSPDLPLSIKPLT